MHGPIYDYLEKKKLKFSYQGYFKKKKKIIQRIIFRIVRVKEWNRMRPWALKPATSKEIIGTMT